MRTTGEVGVGTSGAAAEEKLVPRPRGSETHIIANNIEGDFAGFFSIKGSTGPFVRLPKGAAVTLDGITVGQKGVFLKREGTNDLTNIFIAVW